MSCITTADLSSMAEKNADEKHHHSFLGAAMNQCLSLLVKYSQNSSVYFLVGGSGFSYNNYRPLSAREKVFSR